MVTKAQLELVSISVSSGLKILCSSLVGILTVICIQTANAPIVWVLTKSFVVSRPRKSGIGAQQPARLFCLGGAFELCELGGNSSATDAGCPHSG